MECGNQDENVPQNLNKAATSLVDLNDHCLLKVFDYLYINDMINFGETCTQLQNVLLMAVKQFKEFDYSQYKRYACCVDGQPISFEKILSYVSPHIESLYMYGNGSRLWLHAPIEKECHFKKLKSLRVGNSRMLKWISAHNLEKLEINKLQRSDLNNFTSGITKLKQLKFLDYNDDVPAAEFISLMERNPNIESLTFGETILFKLQNDHFPKLRNLKHVEFAIGAFVPELTLLLQIEELTSLSIEFKNETFYDRQSSENNMQKIYQFLKRLAEKKTLKSLQLRFMHFDNASLFDSLAALDLVSLRIVCPKLSSNLCLQLANRSFANLTDLEFKAFRMEIGDIMQLIEHFKALQRLKVHFLQKLNSAALLRRLGNFLAGAIRKRPNLEITNFYFDENMVKIFFDRRCYEVINSMYIDPDDYNQYRGMFDRIYASDVD